MSGNVYELKVLGVWGAVGQFREVFTARGSGDDGEKFDDAMDGPFMKKTGNVRSLKNALRRRLSGSA